MASEVGGKDVADFCVNCGRELFGEEWVAEHPRGDFGDAIDEVKPGEIGRVLCEGTESNGGHWLILAKTDDGRLISVDLPYRDEERRRIEHRWTDVVRPLVDAGWLEQEEEVVDVLPPDLQTGMRVVWMDSDQQRQVFTVMSVWSREKQHVTVQFYPSQGLTYLNVSYKRDVPVKVLRAKVPPATPAEKSVCSNCGGTGRIPGDTNTPPSWHESPCPVCQFTPPSVLGRLTAMATDEWISEHIGDDDTVCAPTLESLQASKDPAMDIDAYAVDTAKRALIAAAREFETR